MHPTDKAARVAGALYLSLAVTAPFSLIYVPNKLFVRGNATATANNILAHETLFRLGIVTDLITTVIFIFVVMALYRLLNGVNKSHASLMVILALISVPISFLGVVNEVVALTLLHGADYLSVFDKHQLDALAMLFLGVRHNTILVNEIFWGLWLFPFGVLVMRSRFLPRILGLLLIVNGFAYLAVTFTELLLPDYASAVNQVATIPETGELWLMLWLLIKGAKVKPLAAATA
jgi:hypothetical protein